MEQGNNQNGSELHRHHHHFHHHQKQQQLQLYSTVCSSATSLTKTSLASDRDERLNRSLTNLMADHHEDNNDQDQAIDTELPKSRLEMNPPRAANKTTVKKQRQTLTGPNKNTKLWWLNHHKQSNNFKYTLICYVLATSLLVILMGQEATVHCETQRQASRPPRQIDCQRFVFAPGCRGISAKRSSRQDLHFWSLMDMLDQQQPQQTQQAQFNPSASINNGNNRVNLLQRNRENQPFWFPIRDIAFSGEFHDPGLPPQWMSHYSSRWGQI